MTVRRADRGQPFSLLQGPTAAAGAGRQRPVQGGVLAIMAAGTVVMGGAGWSRGPAWAAGGVLAGPFVAVVAYVTLLAYFGPDPQELLDKCQWQDALTESGRLLWSWRGLAAKRPGVFSDALAITLKQQRNESTTTRPRGGSIPTMLPLRGCARASSWPRYPGTGTRRDHWPGPGRYPANATCRSPTGSNRR